MSVTVRVGRQDDDAALADLDRRAWSPAVGFPSVRPTGTGFFAPGSPPEAHVVAEVDGRVAGYARLLHMLPLVEAAHVLTVAGLAVAPDLQGRGVGHALLAGAEEQARRSGARKLAIRVLATNPAARRLYERYGFTVEGVLVGEFLIEGRPVDDVVLGKSLA